MILDENIEYARIVLTYRPLTKNPISWINAITRWIQGYPRDHIAIKRGEFVYESTIKKMDGGTGVQKILWEDWVDGRMGTWCKVFVLPADEIDWMLLKRFTGTKYDTRAAIFHFLQKIDADGKWSERLRKRKDRAVTCSEYFAIGAGMPDAFKALPVDCEKWLYKKPILSYQFQLKEDEWEI